MAFHELTKPGKGFRFCLWRLLVDINWARTWTWCEQTEDGKKRRTLIISLHTVQQHIDGNIRAATTLVFGPLKLMFGWVT